MIYGYIMVYLKIRDLRPPTVSQKHHVPQFPGLKMGPGVSLRNIERPTPSISRGSVDGSPQRPRIQQPRSGSDGSDGSDDAGSARRRASARSARSAHPSYTSSASSESLGPVFFLIFGREKHKPRKLHEESNAVNFIHNFTRVEASCCLYLSLSCKRIG